MFHYKSYYDLSRDIAKGLQILPECDVVVGIPKSGIIPATIVASFLNKPFIDLDAFIFTHTKRSGMRKFSGASNVQPRVLLVDDSINTGHEFTRVRKRIAHLENDFEFKLCAVYGKDADGHVEADVVLDTIPQPRVFQWNYRHHIIAEHALFDMDGVLCLDPTNEDNDDGDKYRQFIATAQPLAIPPKQLAAIVTSRLERFRSETEDWLEANGVKYKELIMLDLPTAAERRRLKAHAPFKAEVYKDRSELLFVESNWKQAQQIAVMADKPVICTENDALLWGASDVAQQTKSGQLFNPSKQNLVSKLRADGQVLANRLAQLDPASISELEKMTFDVKNNLHKKPTTWQKNRAIGYSLLTKKGEAAKPAPKSKGPILMISVSFDIEKGAGAAASSVRLRDSLRALGKTVHAIDLEDFTKNPLLHANAPLKGTEGGYWSANTDYDQRTALLSRINSIDPSCIILGAIDRGILSPLDIAQIDYPIVWVNRDNWSHTGGCLFKLDADFKESSGLPPRFMEALTCEKYKTGCVECPIFKDKRESSKAQIQYGIKKLVYDYRKDIVMAPISPWLEGILRESPLTSHFQIKQIFNPIPRHPNFDHQQARKTFRSEHNVEDKTKLVLLSALSIDNMRKGTMTVLDGLKKAGKIDNVRFVTMGKSSVEIRAGLGGDLIDLGFVSDEQDKLKIYAALDAVVVPALQESLSVIASDSLVAGVPVVAYETTGLSNIIQHKETGYLATRFNGEDLIEGLKWVLEHNEDSKMSEKCIEAAHRFFDMKQNISKLLDAIDLAKEGFAQKPPLPLELQIIDDLMTIQGDDLKFKYMDTRFLRNQLRQSESGSKDSQKRENMMREMREKLDWTRDRLEWNRNKVMELEAEIAKSGA